jgi:hypothetical protein
MIGLCLFPPVSANARSARWTVQLTARYLAGNRDGFFPLSAVTLHNGSAGVGPVAGILVEAGYAVAFVVI